MDKKEKDNTDAAPIVSHPCQIYFICGKSNIHSRYFQRPVSSLLSHFENLTHIRPSAAQTGSSAPESHDGSEASFAGRASLDLPRPDSQWGSSNISQGGQSYNPPRNGFGGLSNGGSPGRRGQSRPRSMNFRSSPQQGPTLTVDSPRSPPKGLGQNSDSGRPSIPAQSVDSSPSLRPTSRSTFNQNGHTSTHPTTPSVDSRGTGPNHQDRPISANFKRSPTAPPINRADKPKVPPKASNLLNLEGLGRGPPSQGTSRQLASSEDRVSPFSTPPSSPERSASSSAANGRPGRLLIPDPKRSDSAKSPREPRPKSAALRSSSRGPAPEIVRETKPNFNDVATGRRPSSMAPQDDSSRHPGTLKIDPSVGDSPEDRPGLPPRNASPRPGNNANQGSTNRVDTKGFDQHPRSSIDVRPGRPDSEKPSTLRSTAEPGTRAPPPPPARRDTSRRFANDSQPSTPQTSNPPPFSRESKHTSPSPAQRQPTQVPRDDSDESELPMEDTPVSLTDYPDASQANRRPPFSKPGPHEIPTRYDTRCFDVCGQYVCTTGYITKVWDLVTGEQLVLLSHGETVKVLSIAFKPGKDLDSEGQRLWLGTTSGELHEVDISTKSIVSSRTSPSRREVIKIYRHKRELWTLDDEGRLLMWPPDESGTPNLQYSYSSPYDRVARGHTFSMVVGDILWLATGKDVRLYRLSSPNDSNFQVLKKPLGQNHTGEVTSGAMSTKNGGRVYLGHADGKVTIYSNKDYSCLGSVSVSVYKINCLAFVGDYLWAAFKTGMIYVYDTSTNPWRVKKDWQAHNHPVCGLVSDQSSIWTMNRLLVTSLGTDNYIRLWDGMLEDDWLGLLSHSSLYISRHLLTCCIESQMQDRDVDYCDFREIRASIISWNAGAAIPNSLRDSTFLRDAINPEKPPEILVFGFQELVDLEDKKITAS